MAWGAEEAGIVVTTWPTRMVAVALALVLGAAWNAAEAVAQGECPPPRVFVAEWMPDDHREGRAQSLVMSANREGIRWLIGGKLRGHRAWLEQTTGVSLGMFDEYILTSSSTADAVTLNLVDGKGRPVASATGPDPEAVAQQMSPVLEKIREHQRRVREEEHIAIDAWIYTNPMSAKIEVDEEIEFTFELIDCDGYELFDRVVEIEVQGPGVVEPTVVTTDGNGRGEFTFTGEDPGTAVITLWYVYEGIETAGVKSAHGDDRIVVQIEGDGALVEIEMSGEGYSALYEAWNCDGIEGEWQLRGELDVTGYGTISGGGDFYMPPRPEEGAWDSEPFSYSMSGTLDMDGATADILYEFEDVVFTVIELEEGPTLGDARGTAKATVRVTTPEFSMVVSETYTPVSIAPALIRDEQHASCE